MLCISRLFSFTESSVLSAFRKAMVSSSLMLEEEQSISVPTVDRFRTLRTERTLKKLLPLNVGLPVFIPVLSTAVHLLVRSLLRLRFRQHSCSSGSAGYVHSADNGETSLTVYDFFQRCWQNQNTLMTLITLSAASTRRQRSGSATTSKRSTSSLVLQEITMLVLGFVSAS